MQPLLYRGWGANETRLTYQALSLVSATFSRDVAAAHEPDKMLKQSLPVERLFMTFLEPIAMSQQFKEAEPVLLADPANAIC